MPEWHLSRLARWSGFRYLTLPMNALYNRFAGHSVERLAALSDGIFAVAMTLLAIDLRLPAAELIHSEADLLHALFAVARASWSIS